MATAECCFGGGLNSSSGGELKLYLGCTGSTKWLTPLVRLCFVTWTTFGLRSWAPLGQILDPHLTLSRDNNLP